MVGYSCPPWLYVNLLHFSHHLSDWSSPSSSSTTFQNFPVSYLPISISYSVNSNSIISIINSIFFIRLCYYSVRKVVDISASTSLIGQTVTNYSYHTTCFDHQESIFRPFKICIKICISLLQFINNSWWLKCHNLIPSVMRVLHTHPLLLLDLINLKTFKQMYVVCKVKNERR